MTLFAILLFAAEDTPGFWEQFLRPVTMTLIFSLLGIFLAIVGFKLFDAFTPGDLADEIIKKQNLAAAILGAAVILGICLIIARVVGT